MVIVSPSSIKAAVGSSQVLKVCAGKIASSSVEKPSPDFSCA